MPSPLLELVGVTKHYASLAGGPPLEVLGGISLQLRLGESLAIVGPSGSGKSTLLNIIGTLDYPTAGRVLLEGQDLGGLTPNRLAAVRHRHIGFVFQAHHLLPHCTALENVLVPALAAADGPSPAQLEPRARQLLTRVGLGERLNHFPGHLSGGERQRVAVVRALINRPKLLLADEPTGALDRASARTLGQLLVDLNHEEQVTLIAVTHALELAGRLDRQLELRDGQLQPPTHS